MMWFYAENGAQKGPVTDEELRQLAAAGTVRPDTLLWREGMADWRPFSEVMTPVGAGGPTSAAAVPVVVPEGSVVCSECGKVVPRDDTVQIAGRTVCAACKPKVVQGMVEGTSGASGEFNPEQFVEGLRARGGYPLDIGSAFSRGFDLVKANFWPCVGITLLVMVAQAAAGAIPCVGYIAPLIVTGPLEGGLFLYFILQGRGKKATIDDAFCGFQQPRFLNLMLSSLLIQGLPMLVGIVFFVPFYFSIIAAANSGGPEAISSVMAGSMAIVMVPLFLAMMYFYLITYPTYMIVADTGVKFWDGLKLSVKLVHMKIGYWILFALACIPIALLGFLALCVGILVAAPIIRAAVAHIWLDIRKASEEGLSPQWRGVAS